MARANAVDSAGDKSSVWAFDFDGVICDSVGESSVSAWKAATKLWPDIFSSSDASARKEHILKDMEYVRPVVETGYENLVQIRCLLEGVSPDKILNDWHTVLPEYMQKWGVERAKLVELFGGTRDEWMASDLKGWLHMNRFYPNAPELLQHTIDQHETYIVTTKQARFTHSLLNEMAGVPFSQDRIYSTAETGQPKSAVLTMLQERHPDRQYHFVEDKLGTLDKVCKVAELDHWHLYLVDWGYNTEQERSTAGKNKRISVVNMERLQKAAELTA
ncbi:hypothetical protein WJX73_005837 [Symbiochloris irregularis]|uniref:Uncharacterized protein n=1 Tax=Symbiochloris irregularis TaxID=706552 RepID=A0AAW1NZ44_9CHLO